MYPEFIVIYVGMVIIISLLISVLIIMFKMIKHIKLGSTQNSRAEKATTETAGPMPPQDLKEGVVFCKKCSKQFSVTAKACSFCGTQR